MNRFFIVKFTNKNEIIYGATNYKKDFFYNNFFYNNKYDLDELIFQIQNKSSIELPIYNINNVDLVKSSSVQISSIITDSNELIINENIIFYGYLTKIRKENEILYCEISPINNKLNKQYGFFYSSTCRAEFGDGFCKINEINYSITGTVENQIDNYQIVIYNDLIEEFEKIMFYDNQSNKIFQSSIAHYSNKNIILLHQIPSELNLINLKFIAIKKCNKDINSCKKFSNISNFRGEPFIGI
jgi:hypothetical protein